MSLFINQVVGFGAPAHPGFTGYKPAVLPNIIRVTGQSLGRQHVTSMDIWNFFYTLKLSSPDLTITESQKDWPKSGPVSCWGYGNSCTIYNTPKGNTYRVWYGIDDHGRPYDILVNWFEKNTDVTISVDNSAASKYVDYNWAPVFDSMKPVNLHSVQYTKYNSCQCGG